MSNRSRRENHLKEFNFGALWLFQASSLWSWMMRLLTTIHPWILYAIVVEVDVISL